MRKFAFIKPLNYRMRKHIILFFSALLFFVACKENKSTDGIIGQDKMVSLLTEVHIVDGSIYNITPHPDSLYKFGHGKYIALFKRFHTDSIQFKKSLQYYTTQPNLLETMYTQVLKNLENKRDSINKILLHPNTKNALPKK